MEAIISRILQPEFFINHVSEEHFLPTSDISPGKGNLIHVTLWPLSNPSLSLFLKNKGSILASSFLPPSRDLPACREARLNSRAQRQLCPWGREDGRRPRSWVVIWPHTQLHLIKTDHFTHSGYSFTSFPFKTPTFFRNCKGPGMLLTGFPKDTPSPHFGTFYNLT